MKFLLWLPLLLGVVFAADKPARITVQLDWVPEPEHGGFYQAQAKGFFREEGLEVVLLPGGPGAQVVPSVATGKADVGQADDISTLLQQAEGLPLVQFAAVFQDDPSGILVHADSPVRRFEDLQGKTIIARPGWPFLEFLKRKYGLTVNVVAQNFSSAAFLGNKEALQQGYYGRRIPRLRGSNHQSSVRPRASRRAARLHPRVHPRLARLPRGRSRPRSRRPEASPRAEHRRVYGLLPADDPPGEARDRP